MRRLRQYFVIAAAAWAMIVMPTQAMAFEILQCEDRDGPNAGEPVFGTSLFNTDTGGPDAEGSFCQHENEGLRYIFSQVACNFTSIMNDILGKTYCAMQYTLLDTVRILMVLYIVIFGVQILMGTAQLNVSEIMSRLLKIGGVAMFISQSAWGISAVFNFFIGLASQGIWWALNALPTAPVGLAAPTGDLSDVIPVYTHIDDLIYRVVTGPFTTANSELIGFFAVMAYVLPPIFGLALYWLWITFAILARALISFLMCIAALAFLLSLSPIFLSFMLFQATRHFFENWIKFMISFSLQVTVVFMCIAAWSIVSSSFIGFFDDLKAVIFPYQKVWAVAASTVEPVDSWGICPFTITDGALGPKITCVNPAFDPVGPSHCLGDYPIPMVAPPECEAVIQARKEIIPLSDIGQDKCRYVDVVGPPPPPPPGCETSWTPIQGSITQLVYYVIYHLVTLIIIFFAFDALLKQAPMLAKELAGPTHTPILGQGFGSTGFGRVRGSSGSITPRGPSTPGQPGGGGVGGGISGILDQYSKGVGTR